MSPKNHNNSLLPFPHPADKPGVFATILVALSVGLLLNIAAYCYLQAQPVSNELDGGIIRTIEAWQGLATIQEPVSTIILGDSTSLFDLSSGSFADRLGGKVLKLGSNAGSSFLMDAWMLEAYVKRFGPPENVIILRGKTAYSYAHNLEYMSLSPLPWGYWDGYGLSPVWQKGELTDLFIDKFLVLYSRADIIKNRLLDPFRFFDHSYEPVLSERVYFAGWNQIQETMSIEHLEPEQYFTPFLTSKDTDNALQAICNLARTRHFQVYFLMQPEWDEAYSMDLKSEQIRAQLSYLDTFTDPDYVHIANSFPQVFTKDQLQNPQHLRPGADNIFTESYVESIVEIQNKLTANYAQPIQMESTNFDQSEYNPGDTPVITVRITNKGGSTINGGISCLIRPQGNADGNWVVRSSSVGASIPSGQTTQVSLVGEIGDLYKSGDYEVILFIRQDIGSLSHETRIEIPTKIKVNSVGTGLLRVETVPAVPSRIFVNGIPIDMWGTWAEVLPEQYTISFDYIPGYITPAPQTVILEAGETTVVVGSYLVDNNTITETPYGILYVDTDPPLPSRISLNGIGRDNGALNNVKMAPGSYLLSFSDVPGFETPSTITVINSFPDTSVRQPLNTPIEIIPGIIIRVVVNFIPMGTLHITTSPLLPVTIYVDGNPLDSEEVKIDLLPGKYMVSFSPLNGYVTPDAQQVVVTAKATTEVVGNYISGTNEFTQLPFGSLIVKTVPVLPSRIFINGIPRNTSEISDLHLPPGLYTLAFSDVTGFKTPQTITIIDRNNGSSITQSIESQIFIEDGSRIEISANFTPLGTLRISTDPPVPSTIYLNGIPINAWGIWTNIEEGEYTISFRSVAGFITPPPITVFVRSDAFVHIVGDFYIGVVRQSGP